MSLTPYRASYRRSDDPVVTVAPGMFRFSAQASKVAGLESANWVMMSTDKSERLIGFEFFDGNTQPKDSHRLMRYRVKEQGEWKQKTIARSCRAKGLINKNEWIKKVAQDNQGKPRNLKFKLSPYGHNQKIWVIRLAPWFELSVLPGNIGQIGNVTGIYRYRNAKEEVIYIGKGRIADRFREPARRMWEIARIEYSVVPDDKQYEFEKFHLDRFAKENDDHRPRFNKVAGHL